VEERIAVGVVYDPSLDECLVAERGAGAFLDDRRLAVSATADLSASLLATGFPYDVRDTADNNLAEYAAFTRQNRSVRELGSAAITLAAVAAGRLDGYWELVLGPWDVAAGLLLVGEGRRPRDRSPRRPARSQGAGRRRLERPDPRRDAPDPRESPRPLISPIPAGAPPSDGCRG
jgi:fructose-1,6-bisphosphatase/inositol monophosphatase family enzyme